jgi:hypothetical protein
MKMQVRLLSGLNHHSIVLKIRCPAFQEIVGTMLRQVQVVVVVITFPEQ